MSKISGPLLDRIDLHIDVPSVEYQELRSTQPGTSSDVMRQQVAAARRRQEQRFHTTRTRTNSQMASREVRSCCELDAEGSRLLQESVHHLGLSARAHDKVLRVARTIADLEDANAIRAEHLSEAVNYRMLDRKLWS